MKVAISSQGTSGDSALSGFGRARYFVLYDTETRESTHMSNEGNMTAGRGAGTRTAQDVVKSGAEAVISSQIGPKAISYLKGKGIHMYISSAGTVDEAVKAHAQGGLQEV